MTTINLAVIAGDAIGPTCYDDYFIVEYRHKNVFVQK